MGTLILVLLFLSSSSLPLMTQASTSVLAFYVFGDSTVDAGNNNIIEDGIKANFYPCGVDYNNQSTGRFANGLTAVDFMVSRGVGLEC
ncbi:GDSL esterase/lipase [Camellia lanceoleosa]|uniref:GDSL esterase/lipase n=1 Tax=Camellia lanceoleosa TaxID=1840588 RepID=A0ACC0HFA8_9ERIC|nr:GDSL esterase/lipase [Camellia lanceoleosa]